MCFNFVSGEDVRYQYCDGKCALNICYNMQGSRLKLELVFGSVSTPGFIQKFPRLWLMSSVLPKLMLRRQNLGRIR